MGKKPTAANRAKSGAYLTEQRVHPSVGETRKALDKARKQQSRMPADSRRTSNRS
jgi:hypothetical protein